MAAMERDRRAGKSRLAQRLPTILPIMTVAEAVETTRIHRVAGLTGARTTLVTTRPFRAPPQTISDVGRSGGGQMPMPGEGSLAPHGVLFWDELPEVRRHGLEVLRQPLEERVTYRQSRGRPGSLRAGGVGRVGSNTHRLTSPEPQCAKAIPQMCRSTGCWSPLFPLRTEASSLSAVNGDSPVYPCTAAQFAAYARR